MVMIVTDGSGSMKVHGKTYDVNEGYVFFIGHGIEVIYEAEEGLKVHAAYAE
jgi:mannose-6-phosphate isomerase